MKTFRVKYKKNFEGTVKAESLEEAQELCENPAYLYYDVNATDMGEQDFEFEEVEEQSKKKQVYTVYASTINVYAMDIEARDADTARELALDRWEGSYLKDFKIVQTDCDFQVDEAVEADDQETKDEMALAGYYRER